MEDLIFIALVAVVVGFITIPAAFHFGQFWKARKIGIALNAPLPKNNVYRFPTRLINR